MALPRLASGRASHWRCDPKERGLVAEKCSGLRGDERREGHHPAPGILLVVHDDRRGGAVLVETLFILGPPLRFLQLIERRRTSGDFLRRPGEKSGRRSVRAVGGRSV